MFSNKYQNEYKIAESFHIKEMDGKIPHKKNTTRNIIEKEKQEKHRQEDCFAYVHLFMLYLFHFLFVI